MPQKKIKVLAIDDQQDNLDILKITLKRAIPGVEFFCSTDGEKGLALALAKDPDVILLDIVMPGMDGFAVCKRLKADRRLSNIPVVFVTGDTTRKNSRAKALEAGVEGFLAKPFETEELAAQVLAMAKVKAASHAQALEQGRLEALVLERTRALELKFAENKRIEDLLLKLSDQVPGVIYQYRLYPDGRSCFPYASAGLSTIYEVSPQEILEDASVVFGRIHPDDLESTRAAILESARTLELFKWEFRVVLPRQGLRWRQCDAKPERLPDGGTLWHGMITDITDRKRAEEALLESKNIIESVVENVPLMMFLKEAQNLRFVMFNRAGEELLGYDRKDLLGKNDKDFFPPEQADSFMARDRETMSGGAGTLDIPEEPIETAQKGRRLLHTRKVCIKGADGAPKYLLGISEDVTDRKRAEEAMLENFEVQGVLNSMLQHSLLNTSLREKLTSHLAALFALPWLAIQPKGAVFLMNPRNAALVLTAQQGLAPALLETCASVPLGHCLCGRAAATGQPVEEVKVGPLHSVSYAGMDAHGHYCVPITAGGHTLGVLTLYLQEGLRLTEGRRRFIRSVSDIMAQDILHSQTEEKLAQSQKMESIGRLAGGVAHDFNNILTAIKCYAEFVNKGLDPQDGKSADVREILTASDRAIALTRQLLAFSRRQILTPKVVDLNKCVADISNMLRRLIGEDMKLETTFVAAPCLALLDTGQIEQVLVNLVVNARDASPGGGVIKVATEILAPSPELAMAHPDLPHGALVCLTVSDAGSGMAPEVKKHLFEPFFTTKEQGKGTGLGLSTVFGIVKQTGGDIEVESEPGKGTQFRIFFPYSAATSAAPGVNQAQAPEVKGRETILLVEDEESLRRLGRRVLESGGYTVLEAANGQDAVKVLERYGRPVDLLVTDVIMPGMSGRDLARGLARKNLAARTLYMSGYTDDAIVKHGVLDTDIAFIYKPFTVDGLLLKVRTVLDAPAGQAKA
ncbi:MAG: response regulator [Elusimicrobiales bacterium]|nr:response regulator [Elusimicrobiales bacterium]